MNYTMPVTTGRRWEGGWRQAEEGAEIMYFYVCGAYNGRKAKNTPAAPRE